MVDRFGRLGRGKERAKLTRYLRKLDSREVPTESKVQHVIYAGSWQRTWEAVFQAILRQEAAPGSIRPLRSEPLEFRNGEWGFEEHTICYDETWGAEPWKVIGYEVADDMTYHETILRRGGVHPASGWSGGVDGPRREISVNKSWPSTKMVLGNCDCTPRRVCR